MVNNPVSNTRPTEAEPARRSGDEATGSADLKGRRIVITTFGSLGDLHPYLALAIGLLQRGHRPAIVTSAGYRDRVEKLGIDFAPARPDLADFASQPELMKRVMSLRKGSEYVVRELMMPLVAETYSDTLAAAAGADLIISHPLTFTTPLVAETLQVPWVSTMLAPLGFFSAYDPPVIPQAQWLERLRWLGPSFWGFLFRVARKSCRHWSDPCRALRADIGLPPTPLDPLFEGQHSPDLVLAMFSQRMGDRQPDWPASVEVTGFAFYDRDETQRGLSDEVVRFLETGPPPIVFTLGSSAVLDAGSFYEVSAAVARRLGKRAILLIGRDERNRLAALPEGVIACEYAPYSELFPKAAAIVHQGGAGTTGQAMRAGRPMLVMPYAHDQPDNAARMVRLGIARSISRYRYTERRVARDLSALLDDPGYERRAAAVGQFVREEDGVANACDAIDRLLVRVARRRQP